MNILVLNHEYPPIGGGAGNATRHLGACLANQGEDVTVMTSAFEDSPGEEMIDGVRIVRLPALRRREAESNALGLLVYSLAALVRAHRIPRPDAVHAFFGLPGGAIAWALKRTLGVPYVVSFRGKDVHGGRSRDFGGITGLMKTVSLPAWRGADALVANSEGLRQIAMDVDPGASVDVIPNGVDTTRFTPRSETREGGPVEILYVGRLEPYKGIETLLKAFASASKRVEGNVRLRIVGDGSLRAELEAAAGSLSVADAVTFSGWVSSNDIPDVYRNADIYVLPSVVEGMPNGLLESMAAGLPAIASTVPGVEELLVHGTTGLTFAPGDTNALADNLCELIESHVLRQQMGGAARLEAERRSWTDAAASYAATYRRITAAAPSPRPEPQAAEGAVH